MRILQRNLKWPTDTFLFISHTTNVILFKFRCNIFIGVRIIKENAGFGSEWDTLYYHQQQMCYYEVLVTRFVQSLLQN